MTHAFQIRMYAPKESANRVRKANADQDDDDSDLQPPRSSGLEDETFTQHSIELPRRAISEQPSRRFTRGSFGSVDDTDFFNNIDIMGDLRRGSDFFHGTPEDMPETADPGDVSYDR